MSYRKHLMSNDISPSEMYAATAVDSDTDTISRQAALDIFDDYNVAVENGQIEAYSRDRKRLCDLPPVQPERIRGHWINGRCDKCNAHAPFWAMASTYYASNFCPHCGADMRGEQDE